MEQKFKKGNVVKLYGRDELHIILGSYVDMFGGTGGSMHNYGTISVNEGSESYWTYEKHIELVDLGSEDLIVKAKRIASEIEARNRDLNYIVSKWSEINRFPPVDTILFLFDKAGMKSGYLANGEYFTLLSEWTAAGSLFDYIMTSPTEKQLLEVLKKDISEEKLQKIIALFNEVKAIQKTTQLN